MIKRLKKHLLVWICIILALPCFAQKTFARAQHHDYTKDELYDIIDGILQWKTDSIGAERGNLLSSEYLKGAGSTQGDWYAISLGRLGREDDYAGYLAAVSQNVEDRYGTEEKLDPVKSTEWHRIALAVLAAGGDPTDVGDSHIDLIADGVYNRGKTMELGAQGVNGVIWGLLALDSMRYRVPEDAYNSRSEIIQMILENQLEDGGFAFGSSSADPDITGMALDALSPYYNDMTSYTYTCAATGKQVTKTVRQVVDESLSCLSRMQSEEGCFQSWDTENSESISQVLVGLSALGIDAAKDERFIKNGITLLDVLMDFQMSDGGFIHSREYDEENKSADPNESNSMASEQALFGLTAYMRLLENRRKLYDCVPEMDQALQAKIDAARDAIGRLPENADARQVQEAYELYRQIPTADRCYVYQFGKLLDAMTKLGIVPEGDSIPEAMEKNESGRGYRMNIRSGEELSSDIVFSPEDRQEAENIPEQVTTEHRIPVLKAIYKIEQSGSQEENRELLDGLKEKEKRIKSLQEEIDDLNTLIKEQVSAEDGSAKKDRKIIENICERVGQLSEYDRNQIENYEDVAKAETELSSARRSIVTGCAVGIAAIILAAAVVLHGRKRKQEKLSHRMLDWEEDEEDEEEA